MPIKDDRKSARGRLLPRSDAEVVLGPLRSAYQRLSSQGSSGNHNYQVAGGREGGLVDHPKQDELRCLLVGIDASCPVSENLESSLVLSPWVASFLWLRRVSAAF